MSKDQAKQNRNDSAEERKQSGEPGGGVDRREEVRGELRSAGRGEITEEDLEAEDRQP